MKKFSKKSFIALLIAASCIAVANAHAETVPPLVLQQQSQKSENIFYSARKLGWSSAASAGGPSGTNGNCLAIPDQFCSEIPGARLSGRETPDEKYVSFHMLGGRSLGARSVLGICRTPSELDCIVGLNISDSTGAEQGNYVGDYFEGAPFTGSSYYGIPDGRLAPKFSAPNHSPTATLKPNGNGLDYVVRVAVDTRADLIDCVSKKNKSSIYCREKGNQITIWNDDQTGYGINCAKEKSTYCSKKELFDSNNGLTGIYLDIFSLSEKKSGAIATPDLPPGLSFQINFRLSKKVRPYGWFAGHVGEPALEKKLVSGGYEYVVGGKVSPVIEMGTDATCSNIASLPLAQIEAINQVRKKWALYDNGPFQKRFIASNPGASYSDQVPSETCSVSSPRTQSRPLLKAIPGEGAYAGGIDCAEMRPLSDVGSDNGIMECNGVVRFEEVAQAQGDKATGIAHVWRLANTFHRIDSDGKAAMLERCAGDSVVGVVGSNATMFDEMPRINSSNGQLEYQMWAPHISLDGVSPNNGVYSIVVSKDYAKCQWGIEPSSTTFNVGVFNGNSQQTSVQVTAENKNPSFFNLVVDNFHFSGPKVGVIAKDKKGTRVKSVRLRPSKTMSISKVSSASASHISSWFLMSGKCKMLKNGGSVKMAKSGKCRLNLSRYNTKTKSVVRTVIELRP
jgi:hypothetical protein